MLTRYRQALRAASAAHRTPRESESPEAGLTPGRPFPPAWPGPEPARAGIAEYSATTRYASSKARRAVRANHRHRANVNAAVRAERRHWLNELEGRPPGYRIQHHDELVRRFGARRAATLDRSILSSALTFADAIKLPVDGHGRGDR